MPDIKLLGQGGFIQVAWHNKIMKHFRMHFASALAALQNLS